MWKFYGGKEKVKEPPGQDDLKLRVNTKYEERKKHNTHKMGTYFTFHIYFTIFSNPEIDFFLIRCQVQCKNKYFVFDGTYL